MFALAAVKKLPQNMGRSSSGFGKTAKSNTYQEKEKTKLYYEKHKPYMYQSNL